MINLDGLQATDKNGLTGQQWMAMLFEFENCEECGKDDKWHIAVNGPFGPGTWFARCIDRDVKSVFRSYAKRGRPKTWIANAYGVPMTTVNKIVGKVRYARR